MAPVQDVLLQAPAEKQMCLPMGMSWVCIWSLLGCRAEAHTAGTVTGQRYFLQHWDYRVEKAACLRLLAFFFKDAVCIDRFLDDALEKKKKKINVPVIVPGRAVDW